MVRLSGSSRKVLRRSPAAATGGSNGRRRSSSGAGRRTGRYSALLPARSVMITAAGEGQAIGQ